MLETTMGELYRNYTNFVECASSLELRLSTKVSLAVAFNMRTMFEALKDYEKSRISIATKYGQYDEESNTYHILPETEEYDKAMEEFNEIDSVPVSVSIITLPMKEFESSNLTVSESSALMFMIREYQDFKNGSFQAAEEAKNAKKKKSAAKPDPKAGLKRETK